MVNKTCKYAYCCKESDDFMNDNRLLFSYSSDKVMKSQCFAVLDITTKPEKYLDHR